MTKKSDTRPKARQEWTRPALDRLGTMQDIAGGKGTSTQNNNKNFNNS